MNCKINNNFTAQYSGARGGNAAGRHQRGASMDEHEEQVRQRSQPSEHGSPTAPALAVALQPAEQRRRLHP